MAYGNYYNMPMMQPNNYGYNGYSQPMIQQPIQPMQQNVQPQLNKIQNTESYAQPQPIYKQIIGLQGKSVDSIDVVKAMDIPLDGTISFFPLTDGSAIVTKQIQMDGTSKTIIYKPSDEKEPEKKKEIYITMAELDEKIKKINSPDIKEDIKNIKRQIKDLSEDIKDINDSLNDRKDR